MKNIALPLVSCIALQLANASATEKIVTLGDSLSFAYEAEFGFKKNITGFGSVGEGMPVTVRNWIETLSNPAYRGDRFDLGARDSVTVKPPYDPPFDLYFRQSGNWSIPGLKIHQMRQFLEGTQTFTSIIGSDSNFSTLSTILRYSNFNQATQFSLTDLDNQIQNTADRLTIVIGGNDIKTVYGDIYNGSSPGTFVPDFMADLTAILNHIQTLKPTLQIVVTNVPQVGITPLIRAAYPYDPVKTEHVSAVLRDLNGQIAALAATRKVGYADIYTPTLPMLNGNNLVIQGVSFINDGTSSGSLADAWLNGSISNNFHPNTNGQAVIANEIVHAFNKRYHTGIAPLTATEMLVGLSGKTAADVEIPFAAWMTEFGLAGKPASDDSDGDGISAGVEFALGLDPTRADSDLITSGIVGSNLELAYPQRLPGSARYTLVPESSTTLSGSFSSFGVLPTAAADGLFHAAMPLSSGTGFLRLKATTSP